MEDGLIRYDTPNGVYWTRPNDFVNAQLEDRGGHQLSELGMLRSFIREGDVVLDVGAHIGTFTVPLACAVGETGRVHSFEPVPESFQILEKNIAVNEMGARVTVYNVIVTDTEGLYHVTLSDDHTSAAHFELDDSQHDAEEVGVKTLTLDAWAGEDDAALTRFDVMKVDTEGMELRVLRSARGLIQRFRPILMAEMSADHLKRQGDSLTEVGEFLRGYGYHFFRNLGSRDATTEDFALARIFSPSHIRELYDLVAIHPSSDRYPKSFESPWPTFWRWLMLRARSAPAGLRRRLLGR